MLSQLLNKNPQLVSLVHQDLAKMLSKSDNGRKSEYTSEQILRSLIVMFVERDSFRQVVIRIENSEFLRHFVGLGIKPMMDYSFLDKAFCVLSDRTWEAMNRVLAQYAKEQEKISSEKLRLDTTVYETNIHYPSDSSLLWDSFRTLARLLQQTQQELPQLALKHRFHVKKVKKLFLFITRTDKGFYENMKQIMKLKKNITTVSICKKGRRNQAEYNRESSEQFKDGQRFRAGWEGSISVLKRAFKLGRCFFKGYKNYAASVGCAVFCHNLVLLTKL